MLTLLIATAGLAGTVIAEVKTPARLSIDGEVVAEVYREGRLVLPFEDGEHQLVVTTNGDPRSYPITVGMRPVVIMIGRSGTTVGTDDPMEDVATGDGQIRFRSAGRERLLVQVGHQRVMIAPGAGTAISLPIGEHSMTVRNTDGTSIFARGVLTVSGGADLLVQVAEGKLPETSGEGLTFDPVGP